MDDPKCALFTTVVSRRLLEVLQSYFPSGDSFDSWSTFVIVSVKDLAFRSNSLKKICAFINQFMRNKQSLSSSTLSVIVRIVIVILGGHKLVIN